MEKFQHQSASHSNPDEIFKKYLKDGYFKSKADIHSASQEYVNSDFFKKTRKKLFVDPFKFGLSLKELRELTELELIVKEFLLRFEHEEFKVMAKLHQPVVDRFIEAMKVFPPPIEVYIPHGCASCIFDAPDKKLNLYRKFEIINVEKHQGSFYYHWTQIQELFS